GPAARSPTCSTRPSRPGRSKRCRRGATARASPSTSRGSSRACRRACRPREATPPSRCSAPRACCTTPRAAPASCRCTRSAASSTGCAPGSPTSSSRTDRRAVDAIAQFLQQVRASLDDGTFVGLTLSSPVAGATDAERVRGRLVELKSGPHLSMTIQAARRDTVENVPLGGVTDWLRERLGSTWRAALLATTAGDRQLAFSRRGAARVVAHPARRREVPFRTHDRPKHRRLGESAQPWLQALELVTPDGRPRPGRGAKLAQLERYAEILEHLLRDLGTAPGAGLSVVDVVSGRGSLTFTAWHLLRKVLGLDARVTGIEARDELVATAARIAGELGCTGLGFRSGDIASADLPPCDVRIALHACDTATDHAIRRGVESQARLIVVAPCCHRELRPQLQVAEPLAGLLAHGLMAERLAELATDALRIAWLEDQG